MGFINTLHSYYKPLANYCNTRYKKRPLYNGSLEISYWTEVFFYMKYLLIPQKVDKKMNKKKDLYKIGL